MTLRQGGVLSLSKGMQRKDHIPNGAPLGMCAFVCIP